MKINNKTVERTIYVKCDDRLKSALISESQASNMKLTPFIKTLLLKGLKEETIKKFGLENERKDKHI